MEKKSLIILGGSLYELPLLLAAKQKGYFIYLVDIDPNAAGHNVADVSINLSTKDIESIKRYIDSLPSLELKSIVGIGSVDSDVHATIAALSNHLNLKHFNYTLSEIITNKYKMYTLLRGYIENGYFTGLNLIQTELHWFYSAKLENLAKIDMVLKPTENMGGLGVIRVSKENLYESFLYCKKNSPTGEIISEPFLSDDTYKVQLLIGEREIAILNVWKIQNINSRNLIERYRTDIINKKISDTLIKYSLEIIERLKIYHTACEIKYIVSSDKIYLLDINLRLEGGFFIDQPYQEYLNYDILSNYILIITGKEPIPRKAENLVYSNKNGKGMHVFKIYPKEQPVLKDGSASTYTIKRDLPDVPSSKYYDKILFSKDRKKPDVRIIARAKEESLEKDILANAIKNFAGKCKVCKICDGSGCIGELPGMGGAYKNESFIANYYDLRDLKLELELLSEKNGYELKIKNELFGKDVIFPLCIAPISGVTSNLGGVLDEEEFYLSLLNGANESRILSFIGDGSSDSKYLEMDKFLKKAEYSGIITLKPRTPLNSLIKKLEYFENTPITAISIDIDSITLPTLKKSDVPVGRLSLEQIKILRKSTKKNLIIKGVGSIFDCIKLAEAGINSVIISNHGGRSLSSLKSSISMLLDIDIKYLHKEYPDLIIGFDGGVRCGEDIVKLLILGIDYVLIGRPFAIYAAGGGKKGVSLLVHKLYDEFSQTLKLLNR
ncbi:MAG: alpha-hydroxy-acid oxidizing protein [Spirochaetes bacterium]|nr:alpha-hydroxy-acid oxidizing protein [Spirochaetota bacterium]MBP8992045.1 alpha-hydroxy-acid oxidizing protein [Spirochaetota bacterium]HOV46817.1 alpha-hydroxy-acid oxidizing protein [Exilispira sp.]